MTGETSRRAGRSLDEEEDDPNGRSAVQRALTVRMPGALASRVRSFRTWARAKVGPGQRPPQQAGVSLEEIAEARLGSVLKAKYRLDRVLGVGGMAAVYVATHRNRRKFAVKVLHPHLSLNAQVRVRFQREGWLANTVNHRGAVAALDDDVTEDGSAFLVMELLEGSSVEALWRRHGRALPVPIAIALGAQLLEVLSAAHARRIVHRDLKPANLFLTRDGVLKVLDFGIARLHEAVGDAKTRTGVALGTPGFMPPEQAMGNTGELDTQADLWAVGATLFSLISGHFVHEGETAQLLLLHAATRPARPLISVAPGVPSAVARVIDRALAFDKRQRFANAAAMREALQAAHREAFGSPLDASPQALKTWFEAQRSSLMLGRAKVVRGAFTGRRLLWVAAALLVALTAGALLFARAPAREPSVPNLPAVPVQAS